MSWHDRLQDLRVARRSIARRPGFAVAAIATLGLAIGAMAAMVSVVTSVLGRPLPVQDPDRLVTVCEVHQSVAGFCVASPPNVMSWADEARSFSAIGLARDWSLSRRVDGRTRGLSAALATDGWFRTLGITPEEGRLFEASDVGPAAARVAVVSHAFAVTSLADRPSPVGATVVLDDSAYTVIGVLPAGLAVPLLEDAEVWLPLPFDPRDESRRGWRGFRAVARLAPGVDRRSAESELRIVERRIGASHPESTGGWDVALGSLHDAVVGSARPALLAFLGATALAVLIAVVNLSTLLLVRWWDRGKEIAVREALGGSRARIAVLLLSEAGLVAVAGAALGAVLAPWLTRAFVLLAPPTLPRLHEIAVEPRVLLAALLGAVALTLGLALLPTLRTARRDLASALRSAGQRSGAVGRPLLQRSLVVAELALATMLLVGATLLGRSFATYLRWNPGFDHDRVAVLWTILPQSRFATADQALAGFESLREAARGVPGVTRVSQTSSGPLFGGSEPGSFAPGAAADDARLTALWHDVGPDYFGTLGLPVVRGRDLAETDRRGAPLVAVVNETFARRAWPGGDPIGRTVREARPDGRAFQVVGMVADVAPWRAGTAVEPEIYWPFAQGPRWGGYLVIRTVDDPTRLARALEQRLLEAVPDAQVGSLRTLSQAAERLLVTPRFTLLLVGGYGLLTLLVAGVGLYGVVDFLVSRRRRELAIRIALGAPALRVTRSVLREGLLLGVTGAALGVLGALALRRFRPRSWPA